MATVQDVLDRALRRAGLLPARGATASASSLTLADVVWAACRRARILPADQVPSGEMIDAGREEAARMIAGFEADGLTLRDASGAAYTVTGWTLTTTWPFAASLEDGFVAALAARMAGFYGASVPDDVREAGRLGDQRLRAAFAPVAEALDELNAMLSGFEADGLVFEPAYSTLAAADEWPWPAHLDGVGWLLAGRLVDPTPQIARHSATALQRIYTAFRKRTAPTMPLALIRLPSALGHARSYDITNGE